MKDASAEYIAKEEATQRQPAELYHFWVDGDEHWRYTDGDIAITFDEVARIIKDENPDVILLQELDEDAKRTDYENQFKKILAKIDKSYAFYSASYYCNASFIPHPTP